MSIGAVVLFTLLLVTGNTMAMAVRERVPELGVLKTLGFGDKTVLFLVLAESLVIAAAGGTIGISMAKLFTMGGDPTGGMLPIFYLSNSEMLVGLPPEPALSAAEQDPPGCLGSGLGIALFVGLVAGSIPALTAMNLRIVDALRRV